MADVPVYPKKAWGFFVYMAGDNDLEPFGNLDVAEMDCLSSDDHIHVVVQFDSRAHVTYRYRFFPGSHEQVGEPLGEINTGNPESLTAFTTWAKDHFPAEQTALVIWNHGTGPKNLPPDFDYSAIRSADRDALAATVGRALFKTTIQKLAARQPGMRGVALDATDRDYLDNLELQAALARMPGEGPRVDLLGFDACLMNCVEIAYQMREVARWMVGSQETEPGKGWPYDQILAALAAEPQMPARRLAEVIVTCYARSTGMKFRGFPSPFTQSALDLSQAQRAGDLMRALVAKLNEPAIKRHVKVEQFLRWSSLRVKRFRGRDMVDLLDWCQNLERETKGRAGEPFREELSALQAHLVLGSGLITATLAHGGNDAERIHGVSAYWPQENYSTVYDSLDIATAGWGEMAKWAVDK